MNDRWLIVTGIAALALVGLAGFSCQPSQPSGSSGSVVHQVVSGPFVLEYSLVSSERVGRTRFRYEFDATLTNEGSAIAGLTAEVSSVGLETTVLNQRLVFPRTDTGVTSQSRDTFAVEQDRALPFDPSNLVWRFDPWVMHVSQAPGVAEVSLDPSWSPFESTDAVEVISPDGSRFVVLPTGSHSYGIEGDFFEELNSQVVVSGFSGSRTDFVLQGTPVFARVELLGVPGHPQFRVDLQYGSEEDDSAALEQMLSSLVLENTP